MAAVTQTFQLGIQHLADQGKLRYTGSYSSGGKTYTLSNGVPTISHLTNRLIDIIGYTIEKRDVVGYNLSHRWGKAHATAKMTMRWGEDKEAVFSFEFLDYSFHLKNEDWHQNGGQFDTLLAAAAAHVGAEDYTIEFSEGQGDIDIEFLGGGKAPKSDGPVAPAPEPESDDEPAVDIGGIFGDSDSDSDSDSD